MTSRMVHGAVLTLCQGEGLSGWSHVVNGFSKFGTHQGTNSPPPIASMRSMDSALPWMQSSACHTIPPWTSSKWGTGKVHHGVTHRIQNGCPLERVSLRDTLYTLCTAQWGTLSTSVHTSNLTTTRFPTWCASSNVFSTGRSVAWNPRVASPHSISAGLMFCGEPTTQQCKCIWTYVCLFEHVWRKVDILVGGRCLFGGPQLVFFAKLGIHLKSKKWYSWIRRSCFCTLGRSVRNSSWWKVCFSTRVVQCFLHFLCPLAFGIAAFVCFAVVRLSFFFGGAVGELFYRVLASCFLQPAQAVWIFWPVGWVGWVGWVGLVLVWFSVLLIVFLCLGVVT